MPAPSSTPLQIKIKGQQGLFSFKDVEKTVVKIGETYYLRHDPDLVKVPNVEGKIRFFRKDSPYVVQLESGEFAHKSTCVKTEDGLWFKKGDASIVEVEGKYVRKTYVFKHTDGQYRFLSDPAFVKCKVTGAHIEVKDAILLSQKYYGPNYFIGKDSENQTVTTAKGDLILKKNEYKYLDSKTGDILIVHTHDAQNMVWATEVFHEFQDKTNPQENRLVLIRATEKNFNDNFVQVDFTQGDGPRIYVHKTHVEYVEKCINDFIMPRRSSELEKIRKKINSNYADLDDTENIAKSFKIIPNPYPGKAEIFTPRSYSGYINKIPEKKSNTFAFTGGLKFSFGLEFETSQGLTPSAILEKIRLMAVGDRSIGAAEYVTLPCEGDAGVNYLKEVCEALGRHTLVDDRCGLHVHVGGLSKETMPSFSKEFIKNAVNLGCLLEEEIYQCMPISRTPTLYHCHSIRRFGPVTEGNFNDNIGAYIFGEKEKWVNSKGEAAKLFPFSKYSLGPDRNARSSVGTWADGRYKWLNIIHAFLNTGHKTLEFRIFPGTVNFEKTYAYLLLSMAFTHVADNEPSVIKKGVTLEQLFKVAYKKYPDIVKWVTSFYEERKLRFNRQEIYPKLETLTFLK